MKVLITGARGLLGSELSRLSKKEHEILETDIDNLDIRNTGKIEKIFNSFKPSIIINCAVIGPKESEQNKTLAKEVNVLGLKKILKYKDKAKLIHFSSPAVFDAYPPLKNIQYSYDYHYGYKEQDVTKAKSVYGRTKIASERLLFGKKDCLLIRTSWLYSKSEHLNNIKIYPINEIGRPTHCEDIWKFIKIALDEHLYGLFHICGPEIMSRYGQARILLGNNFQTIRLNEPIIRPLSITKSIYYFKKYNLQMISLGDFVLKNKNQ